MLFRRSKFIFLFLFIVFSLVTFTGSSTPKSSDSLNTHASPAGYIINGNNDLLNLSLSEGWEGDGTPNNPIIITGLFFNQTKLPLNISNVDLHLKIFNNYLLNFPLESSERFGIFLNNVSYCDITNNTFTNSYRTGSYGIYLCNTSNILISCNDFIGFDSSIFLFNSKNILVIHNSIFGYTRGIDVKSSLYINVTLNKIENCITGMEITYINNSIFNSNNIQSNVYGIVTESTYPDKCFSSNVVFSQNFIANNHRGLVLEGIEHSNVTKNKIHSNSQGGLIFKSRCHGILVFGNEFLDNSNKAIRNEPLSNIPNDYKIYNNIFFPEEFYTIIFVLSILTVLIVSFAVWFKRNMLF